MSKNKFFKKLLVAGLCALTATATIGGTVACKSDDGKEDPPIVTEDEYTVTWNLDGGSWPSGYTAPTKVKDGEKITAPTAAQNPTKDGYMFKGWVDSNGTAFNFETAITANMTIKATWEEEQHVVEPPAPVIPDPKVPEYEGHGAALEAGKVDTVYEFNPNEELEAGTYDEEWTDGIFSITAKTVVATRTRVGLYNDNTKINDNSYEKPITINNTSSKLIINSPADNAKLVLYVENGSGSKISYMTLSGTSFSQEINNKAGVNNKLQLVEVTLPKAGKYTLSQAANTNYVFYASLTVSADNAPIKSISVAGAGTTDYYVGQQLDCTGVAVTATHTNGLVSAIDNKHIEFDTRKFDGTKPGTYSIRLKYTVDGNLGSDDVWFATTYNVTVYSYEDLSLATDKTVKESKGSQAGNSVYANHAVRQFYFTGETFSDDGLTVILNGKNGETTKEFKVKDGAYTIAAPDMSKTGKQSVSVSVTSYGITKTKTLDIFVQPKDASLATADSVTLNVNAATADAQVGVLSEGAYNFKTIQQAVDFLDHSGIPDSASKVLNLAAGTYNEKVEIKVPNLTIVGAGKDTTKIEYDSLFGLNDASGFTHTTDSTATLNVRDSAVGFTIKNVTISNYWNNYKVFDEKLGVNYGEHRALAMLVQADKVTVEDCSLLGYQDTLELFTGRHVFKNTYIAGTTDFIFGTNGTTYFYGCEIHSIATGKQKDGVLESNPDGGYVTAFKGCNKGDSDAIKYGAIFDSCTFTADEGVAPNKTALGRPWGAYASVAVINSTLGGHISKTPSSGASKNERYVSMSGTNPTAATVKFVEYNNDGDGAITAQVSGMKMLSDAEALKYSDLSVIFGTENGYSAVWDVTVK